MANALAITSTSGSQFNIDISTSGSTGFSNLSSYSWIIASAASITGFDPTKFSFTNNIAGSNGTFSLSSNGTNLTLNYAAGVEAYIYNNGSSAWLTASTWTPTGPPTGTGVAQFGVSSNASVGINMNGATNNGSNNQQVGAIEVTSARTANDLLIGNSSTSANGTLTLQGVTLSGVSNVVLKNSSSRTLTIQDTQGSGNKTMAVALGNATNNIIVIDGAGGIRIDSIISGAGRNLTLQGIGAGILTLGAANTFSGSFSANSGTVDLDADSALGSVTSISVASGALLETSTLGLTNAINDAAAVTLNGTMDLSGGTETIGSLAGTNVAASLVIGKFSTTAGSFTVGDSTSTSFAGVITGDPLVAGSTVLTKQGTGVLTLSGTNTYTGVTAITAGGLTATNNSSLGSTTGGTTVASGAVLRIDGTAGNLSIGAEALTLNGTGLAAAPAGALRNILGSNSWAGLITLGSASTINSAAGTLTLSGGITNGGFLATFDGAGNTTVSTAAITGGGGLTKTGAGTLALGNGGATANTYTGLTTVSNGLLVLNKAMAPTRSRATAIPEPMTSRSMAARCSWHASNQVANNASIAMSSGAFSLNGFTETLWNFSNSGGTFTTGAGTLHGTGASITWAGGTNTVNNGGTVDDAHIVITGGTNTVNAGGLLHVLGSGAGLEMTGSTLTLDSSNTTAGKLLLDNDLATLASATTSSIANGGANTNAGNIDLNGNSITFTVANGAAATDLSVSASIINGSLTKDGAGLADLSGANSYSGTTVSAGTLRLSGSGTLGSTSGSLTVNGGTVDVNGTSQTVGVLAGSGGTILNNGAATSLTVGNGGGSGSYAGTIADGTGTLGLIKTGAGVETLTGANSYDGATAVNAGTLLIDGNQSGATERSP